MALPDDDVVAKIYQLLGDPAPANGEDEPSIFVQWPDFWNKDRREAEWVVEPILARGRGHAFYAKHKVGKSLVMLWLATVLAADPTMVVLYFDYEMGEDDLYERLEDMGCGAETDLSRLRYALLPSLPPLDQPEGAKAILAILDREQAERPDAHMVVIIDTTARAVSGEENSADTIRNFYRWTGLSLKQRGVTWGRLDHAGKDGERGQRGSSAKGDDVDIVWNLTATDDGLLLKRDAARMSWVPERVPLAKLEGPLAFKVVDGGWPAGTKELAGLLDELGVDLATGERPAGKILREAGHKRAQGVVRAALKWRRREADKDLGLCGETTARSEIGATESFRRTPVAPDFVAPSVAGEQNGSSPATSQVPSQSVAPKQSRGATAPPSRGVAPDPQAALEIEQPF